MFDLLDPLYIMLHDVFLQETLFDKLYMLLRELSYPDLFGKEASGSCYPL